MVNVELKIGAGAGGLVVIANGDRCNVSLTTCNHDSQCKYSGSTRTFETNNDKEKIPTPAIKASRRKLLSHRFLESTT